jgi:hypothetical protein
MEVSGQLLAPAALTFGEKVPGTHCIGGSVGPRSGLDAVEKIKSLAPTGNGIPAVQPVAHRYTD